MFGGWDLRPFYPKTIITLPRPRIVRFSIAKFEILSERPDFATTNPRAQQISAARIIIEVGETNVSFGPRFLGRAVSRQAIFPLSRVTQPRRHNSFLHGAITTRREETRRRGGAGPESDDVARALTGHLACNRLSVQSRTIHRSSGTADRFYGYGAIDRSAVRRAAIICTHRIRCRVPRANCSLEFVDEAQCMPNIV